MNKNNHFNQFNIENTSPSKPEHKENESIIAQKMQHVLKEKFSSLFQMYQGDAYENGYNAGLAFRVIWLYLYCQINHQDFNLIEQINRFFNNQTSKNQLMSIQKCMDLLLTKKLESQVPEKMFNLWKIRLLKALKKYYLTNHVKKEKKKVSLILRELCKQQMQKETVRHDSQVFEEILDIYIEEEKVIMNSKRAHNKLFEAIENGNNIIRVLEKCEKSIVPKYQEQLMLGYWQLAKIHNQLHYVTYAKKYAETVSNIADRIHDFRILTASRAMLESLAAES